MRCCARATPTQGPSCSPLADYATLAGGPAVVRPCIDRFRADGRIVDHLGVAHLAFPFWTPVHLELPRATDGQAPEGEE